MCTLRQGWGEMESAQKSCGERKLTKRGAPQGVSHRPKRCDSQLAAASPLHQGSTDELPSQAVLATRGSRLLTVAAAADPRPLRYDVHLTYFWCTSAPPACSNNQNREWARQVRLVREKHRRRASTQHFFAITKSVNNCES